MSLFFSPKSELKSLSSALDLRNQLIWDKMQSISLDESIVEWLETIPNKLTRKNYSSIFNTLSRTGFVNRNQSLQAFALVKHSEILKKIKQQPFSEATNQLRAAAYISFTRHLSEKYEGNFVRAVPSKDPMTKTFSKIRDVVETEAMTKDQWTSFLDELKNIRYRDYLIAKTALQGGKRINEVLTLTTDQIDVANCRILFRQSKTGIKRKDVIITYAGSFINELISYIGSRTGLVFVTRTGGKVFNQHVATTFCEAGIKAGIPFKVTPHVLRASCVTYLKKMGMSDTDIMKVTGHADAEMVAAYDKTSRAENASSKINLIT